MEDSNKYEVWIEDYAVSFLKFELDSLDMHEISFYGKREKEGFRFLIFGVGRGKNIPQFAEYETLEQLSCLLTQAGFVFLIKSDKGNVEVNQYTIFYEANDAMQDYLVEWKTKKGRNASECVDDKVSKILQKKQKREQTNIVKEKSHNFLIAQTSILLILLIAIAVSSINSYDRMEELGQSAKEVLFALENKEYTEQSEDAVIDLAGEGATKLSMKQLMDKENKNNNPEKQGNEAAESEEELKAESDEESEVESEEDLKAESKDESESVISVQPEESTPMTGKEQHANVPEEEGMIKEDAAEAGSKQQTEAESSSYEIKEGDTLYQISQKVYGDFSRVNQICEMNNIANPDDIYFGQKILLP